MMELYIHVYYNMEELCGLGGGWTRLAYLDMINSTENCLSGFKLHHQEELELVQEQHQV